MRERSRVLQNVCGRISNPGGARREDHGCVPRDVDVFAEDARVGFHGQIFEVEHAVDIDAFEEEHSRNLVEIQDQLRLLLRDRTREIERTFHLPGKLKTSSSVTGLTRKSLKRCQDAPVLLSCDETAGTAREFRQKMQRSTEACLTLCQRNQMRCLVLRLDLHDHRLCRQSV